MKTLYERYAELHQQSKSDEHKAAGKIKPLIQESTSMLQKSMDIMSIEQAELLIEDNL